MFGNQPALRATIRTTVQARECNSIPEHQSEFAEVLQYFGVHTIFPYHYHWDLVPYYHYQSENSDYPYLWDYFPYHYYYTLLRVNHQEG